VAQPDRVLRGLGEALHATRSKRGLTQEALSLETGVHRNYIGGIERGERSPSVAAVAELADALGISLADLFRQAERIAG
jgi:transcriptional regulator with XRE-family HTH domain